MEQHLGNRKSVLKKIVNWDQHRGPPENRHLLFYKDYRKNSLSYEVSCWHHASRTELSLTASMCDPNIMSSYKRVIIIGKIKASSKYRLYVNKDQTLTHYLPWAPFGNLLKLNSLHVIPWICIGLLTYISFAEVYFITRSL